MQSAGGMIMSPNDALRWLELQIEDGRLDGHQVLPAAAIIEARSPLVDTAQDDINRTHYGLGWYVGNSHLSGDPLISHGGGYRGFSTHISYMPNRKIGVVTLSNESELGSTLVLIINRFIYDRLLGRAGAYEQARSLIDQLLDARSNTIDWLEARAQNPSTLTGPLQDYVGTYEHPHYGTVQVSIENGRLAYAMGQINTILDNWTEPETMRLQLATSGKVIHFVRGNDGTVNGFGLQEAERYLRFSKQGVPGGYFDPKAITLTAQERSALTGTYRVKTGFLFIGRTLTIDIFEDNGLMLGRLHGEGTAEILPLSKTRFKALGTNLEVTLAPNHDGVVDSIIVHTGERDLMGRRVE